MSGDRQAWAAGVRRIHEQAGGAVVIHVVQERDMPTLLMDAASGDANALNLAVLVSQALHGIARAPRKKPHLCASCPRRLRRGQFSLVFALPFRDDAERALSLAVCQHCGNDYDQIVKAAGRALRRIWPDSRFLDGVHPGHGHA